VLVTGRSQVFNLRFRLWEVLVAGAERALRGIEALDLIGEWANEA
jgi:hypothetical protein